MFLIWNIWKVGAVFPSASIQGRKAPALWWIFFGGVAYTLGAVLYGLGKKKRYMHSVFHLFVLLGSILHFVAIIGYIL